MANSGERQKWREIAAQSGAQRQIMAAKVIAKSVSASKALVNKENGESENQQRAAWHQRRNGEKRQISINGGMRIIAK